MKNLFLKIIMFTNIISVSGIFVIAPLFLFELPNLYKIIIGVVVIILSQLPLIEGVLSIFAVPYSLIKYGSVVFSAWWSTVLAVIFLILWIFFLAGSVIMAKELFKKEK